MCVKCNFLKVSFHLKMCFVRSMEIKYICMIYAFMSTFIQMVEANHCDKGIICPSNLPFCTPSGCAFACPNGSYINGSTCVSHCDDGFIINKECGSQCPENYNYTLEKIVFDGNFFHRTIHCLTNCPLNNFIHNNSCVLQCPDNLMFVENQNCVKTCMNKTDVFYDIKLNNKTVGMKCLERCPSNKKYIDNNRCVEKCTPKYSLNNRCVEKCPNESYVHYNYSPNEFVRQVTDQIICVIRCPFPYNYRQNGMCVSRCSSQHYLISDTNDCVKDCPSYERYISYDFLIDGTPVCSSLCLISEGYYVTNNSLCLKFCPDSQPYALNGSCVSECPNTQPYREKDNLNKTFICKTDCSGKFLENKTCVNYCQKRDFIHGNNCVSSCPNNFPFIISSRKCDNNCSKVGSGDKSICGCESGRYLYNNTCVNECPKSHPILNVIEGVDICANKCSANTYIEENTCVYRCSHNRKLFNGSCLTKCPGSHPLAYKSGTNSTCTKNCPTNFYIQNQTCSIACYNNTYLVDNVCQANITTCPTNQSFFVLIGSNITGSRYIKCLTECPTTFLSNNQNECTFCDMYIYKNRCVENCNNATGEQLIKYHNKTGKYCVNTCLPGVFVLNDTCVDKCPSLAYNAECVDICPSAAPYQNSRACVEACPIGMFLSSNKCVKSCNKEQVVDEVLKLCLETCPNERQYKQSGKCVHSCTNGRIVNSNMCILAKECHKNIIFDSYCLDKCPNGYFWIGRSFSLYDRDTSYCYKVQYFVVGGVASLLFAILCCCCMPFWYKMDFCMSLMNKIRRKSTERNDNPEQEPLVLLNDTVSSIEEVCIE